MSKGSKRHRYHLINTNGLYDLSGKARGQFASSLPRTSIKVTCILFTSRTRVSFPLERARRWKTAYISPLKSVMKMSQKTILSPSMILHTNAHSSYTATRWVLLPFVTFAVYWTFMALFCWNTRLAPLVLAQPCRLPWLL